LLILGGKIPIMDKVAAGNQQEAQDMNAYMVFEDPHFASGRKGRVWVGGEASKYVTDFITHCSYPFTVFSECVVTSCFMGAALVLARTIRASATTQP